MAYRGWRNSARGAHIYNDYLKKITDYAIWLLNDGHSVHILMGEESDSRAVHDLFQMVRGRLSERAAALAFTPAATLQDVMEQMALVDLVVATRYHNVVCALRMRKPTISIGYAEKNDALLTEVGLGHFCQHVEDLDVELLKAQTMQLLAERVAVSRRICGVLERFEGRLREQENILTSLICTTG
jgi:polysaccharide pyruvyl transferase WcaK-like protein